MPVPIPFAPDVLAIVAAGLLFAGIIKGATGLGYATCALPYLVYAVGLKDAIALVLMPAIATNAAVAINNGYLRETLRRFAPLYLAMLPGIASGALMLMWVEIEIPMKLLGASIGAYAGFRLVRPSLLLPARLSGRLLLILSDCSERRASLTALVLTTLWTIHPLQISSVLYVVQRMQTLVTLFTVLAIWCYLEMRRVQLKGGHCRHFGLLALMFWALGLASKEDAILLPLYSLGIELTVLNFRAANQALENLWRRLYQAFLLVGVLGFLFYFLPRHWSWESYPGRDFSSFERLLTQGWILIRAKRVFIWESGSKSDCLLERCDREVGFRVLH